MTLADQVRPCGHVPAHVQRIPDGSASFRGSGMHPHGSLFIVLFDVPLMAHLWFLCLISICHQVAALKELLLTPSGGKKEKQQETKLLYQYLNVKYCPLNQNLLIRLNLKIILRLHHYNKKELIPLKFCITDANLSKSDINIEIKNSTVSKRNYRRYILVVL